MSPARTHFELFELPQRYALDPGELEERYRERSRHWHPDRFSRAPGFRAGGRAGARDRPQ